MFFEATEDERKFLELVQAEGLSVQLASQLAALISQVHSEELISNRQLSDKLITLIDQEVREQGIS